MPNKACTHASNVSKALRPNHGKYLEVQGMWSSTGKVFICLQRVFAWNWTQKARMVTWPGIFLLDCSLGIPTGLRKASWSCNKKSDKSSNLKVCKCDLVGKALTSASFQILNASTGHLQVHKALGLALVDPLHLRHFQHSCKNNQPKIHK